MSRNLWLHQSLKTSQSFCQGNCLALQVDCREIQLYLGSCLDLLHVAHIIEIYSFIFLLLLEPKILWPFVIIRFLTFDQLVQLLVLIIHGLPFFSLDPLVNGLLSPTFVVWMEVGRELLLYNCFPGSTFLSSSPTLTASWLSTQLNSTQLNNVHASTRALMWSTTVDGRRHHDELSEPVHYSEPTSFLQAL